MWVAYCNDRGCRCDHRSGIVISGIDVAWWMSRGYLVMWE